MVLSFLKKILLGIASNTKTVHCKVSHRTFQCSDRDTADEPLKVLDLDVLYQTIRYHSGFFRGCFAYVSGSQFPKAGLLGITTLLLLEKKVILIMKGSQLPKRVLHRTFNGSPRDTTKEHLWFLYLTLFLAIRWKCNIPGFFYLFFFYSLDLQFNSIFISR